MRYAPHRLPPQLKRTPPRIVPGTQPRTQGSRYIPSPGAITLGQWAALIRLRPQTLIALFEKAGVSGLTPRTVVDRAHIETLSAYIASERTPKATPIYTDTGALGNRLVAVGALSKAVLSKIAASPKLLYELAPRKFEEVVAALLEGQGCKIALTKRTRDGGYDIFGSVRAGLSDVVFLAECKRYAAENKVGVELVRNLYGVTEMHKANLGLLITTSRFTSDAIQEQVRIGPRIGLKDFDDLKNWLRPYQGGLSTCAR
jgi:restriction system protein